MSYDGGLTIKIKNKKLGEVLDEFAKRGSNEEEKLIVIMYMINLLFCSKKMKKKLKLLQLFIVIYQNYIMTNAIKHIIML